jgi:hypothetical protein
MPKFMTVKGKYTNHKKRTVEKPFLSMASKSQNLIGLSGDFIQIIHPTDGATA